MLRMGLPSTLMAEVITLFAVPAKPHIAACF